MCARVSRPSHNRCRFAELDSRHVRCTVTLQLEVPSEFFRHPACIARIQHQVMMVCCICAGSISTALVKIEFSAQLEFSPIAAAK